MNRVFTTHVVTVLGGALALIVAGCDVDPYCVTCGEEDASFDAGPEDSGIRRDAQPRDAMPDVELGDGGCLSEELCNDLDDDCDGFVDEGIDTDVDPRNCGECGNECSPPHAFPICAEGECLLGDCDIGWIDLDDDPANGCEYRCLATAEDDAVCDLRDNDCDGRTDEDVELATDVRNCGSCGRVCRFPHSTAGCGAGACNVESCEDGWWNVDGRTDNGCEYACVRSETGEETCNLRDDDCDGTVDEGNPGGGVTCGMDVGACATGITACVAGRIACEGAVVESTELCNGIDDDCDGDTDEGNPEAGRLCGESRGTCEPGREQCMGGSLVCVGAIGATDEVCNGLDDDCDGTVDDGNPGGGGACGETEGACEAGTLTCTGGVLLCGGGVLPRGEICNGLDDDCDGMVDENNPGGGASCGSDVGRCRPGTQQCVMGALVCQGALEGTSESCNALDDDCDGSIDEGNPGGGAACGETTGECAAGALACRSGSLVCEGATLPAAETCNTRDDDCDTRVDEAFDLQRDPRNCGVCGRTCSAANATSTCTMGTCRVASCASGFVDLDGMPGNGCEYACSFRGAEGCNGVDDDCDGRTDEGLTVPTSFCESRGVCAGTTPTCGGAAGWTCTYPAGFQDAETRCDGLDNDCDGDVDESQPLVGTSCSAGIGACRGVGAYVCDAARTGVTCNAVPAASPASEACNAQDDDCDGRVDEVGADDPGTAWRDAITIDAFSTVQVNRAGGGTMRVMQYEASRPDATASSAGGVGTLACSRANVMPWTNVTWAEANAACCAMNAGGTCPGAGVVGWRLCGANDWESACEGPTGTCDWSYASNCTTSQPLVCNGKERDSSPAPGDQDAIAATGAFPMCGTQWAGGRIFDLSGNVKEWTSTAVSAGVYQQRGGAYTTLEEGRACDFDFTVASGDFAHPNTGFRCCFY